MLVVRRNKLYRRRQSNSLIVKRIPIGSGGGGHDDGYVRSTDHKLEITTDATIIINAMDDVEYSKKKINISYDEIFEVD